MEKEYEVTEEGLKETVQVTSTFTLEQCDNQIEVAQSRIAELQADIDSENALIALWQERKNKF